MRVRYVWPAVMLVAVACGGSDEVTPTAEATEAPAAATEAPAEPTEAPAEPTEAPAEPTEAPPAAEDSTTTAALPEECSLPPYDIEIRRSGDGENETFTVVDAEDAGMNARDGGALSYKIFATDIDIADDEDLIDQIYLANLPADASLITLDVARVADPEDSTPVNEYPNIAAGEELVHFLTTMGPDSLGTQVTIATSDGVTDNTSVNPTATGSVLYADDTAVCLNVTIESESGFQLSGVITARVR